MNQLAIQGPSEPIPVMTEGSAVLSLIERASRDPSVDIAKLEKLLEWRDKTVADQRREAFERELAAAKAAIPVVARNATGHNSKKYADFAGIARVIDPILGQHGLSYRFRTVQTDKIAVTCILFGHGHSEETTLSGPADASGSKNAIQAIGSTLTYLQRYSLVQMLGIAAGDDDDGKAAGIGATTIDEQQIGDLTELMQSVGADKAKFLRFFKIEQLAELPAKRFNEAANMLNAKARG
jgi:ERF superfamily